MDAEGKGDHSELTGPCTWTCAMSSFMLSYLAGIVANGNKTSSGFKKVHFNQCARAVNEKFNTSYTRDQIKNYFKTWQRRYQKINRLRNLSAAGFDEEKFIITLDSEHYNDHRKSTPDDNGASSSASRPKKAKTVDNKEGLIGVLKYVGDKLSNTIEKIAGSTPPPAENDVPEDLFETLTSLPGFEKTHISAYYAYLVANPHIARAFYKLPFNYKLNWFAMYISDKFPRC
ncbi:hypothetical protein BAE44_0014128 [Dichanthelium oligosanthes]|uniref:Myb/SANT-like domain-containing protein n=1 Tax=Dichanthelium oligosanthes TaxID=888268 RepID=A0A1E5VI84_9POAL|nr:hypothetical protein BAE44_0014128 [Dichanthelium oligosanthes]